MQDSRTLHYVLGAALVMVAVFTVGSLVMLNSQADTISTSVGVNDADPTMSAGPFVNDFVSEATCIDASFSSSNANYVGGGSGIVIAAGSTKKICINGELTDTNGYEDVTNANLTFYAGPDEANCLPAGPSVDQATCYVVANCTLSSGSGNTIKYSCPITLNYFAESTQGTGAYLADVWKVKLATSDTGGASSTANLVTTNFEVAASLGLTIPSTITYTATAFGAWATTQNMIIAQNANAAQDVTIVDSYPSEGMNCSIPTGVAIDIPVASQKYDLTSVDFSSLGTSLVTAATGAADVNLVVAPRIRADGSMPTKTLYWSVQIPATGVGGSCLGQVTITSKIAD